MDIENITPNIWLKGFSSCSSQHHAPAGPYFDDNKAIIAFGGGCQGCGMADVTLKQGVEVMIKDKVPAITEVIDVTDHAAGTNPFY